jgi:hypothetical protein
MRNDRSTEIIPENYSPLTRIAVWTRACSRSLHVDHGSLLQCFEAVSAHHTIGDIIRSVWPPVDIGRHELSHHKWRCCCEVTINLLLLTLT